MIHKSGAYFLRLYCTGVPNCSSPCIQCSWEKAEIHRRTSLFTRPLPQKQYDFALYRHPVYLLIYDIMLIEIRIQKNRKIQKFPKTEISKIYKRFGSLLTIRAVNTVKPPITNTSYKRTDFVQPRFSYYWDVLNGTF